MRDGNRILVVGWWSAKSAKLTVVRALGLLLGGFGLLWLFLFLGIFEGHESNLDADLVGELDEDAPKEMRIVDEVSWPSLDEALETPFDPNDVTSMAQRLRNLNC